MVASFGCARAAARYDNAAFHGTPFNHAEPHGDPGTSVGGGENVVYSDRGYLLENVRHWWFGKGSRKQRAK